MRRSKRRRNSELDKDEQKLQIALQDIHKKVSLEFSFQNRCLS